MTENNFPALSLWDAARILLDVDSALIFIHRNPDWDALGSSFALAQMLKQPEKGNIVNIGSVAGVLPLRLQVGYVAAKAAVIGLTRAMAVEYAIDGIRVNCVCPGSIMTEGTRSLFYADAQKAEMIMNAIPMHRPGSPEDIAYAVCMMASDAVSSYVTGSILNVDGSWTNSIRSF